jgi:hypothetical protein
MFERHISSSECDPANYARVMKKKKCPVQGCREKLTTINTYTCKSCKQAVCLRHRLENDHKCPGKSGAAVGAQQWGRRHMLWQLLVKRGQNGGKHATFAVRLMGRFRCNACVLVISI